MTSNFISNRSEQRTKRGFVALIAYGWLMAFAGVLLLSDVSWFWSFSPYLTVAALTAAGLVVLVNARHMPDLWGSLTQIYSFGAMALIAAAVLLACAFIPDGTAVRLIAGAMGFAGVINLAVVLMKRQLNGYGMMALSGVFWLGMAVLTAGLSEPRDIWLLMIVLAVYTCVKGVFAIFIAALISTENHDKNQSALFKS